MLELFAGAAVTAAGIFVLARRRRPAGRTIPAGKPAHAAPPSPYAAVSIVPAPASCTAAKKLEGKRFLQREAPTLPLPACSLTTCRCSMKSHRDRRQNDTERRFGLGLKSELYSASGQPERRSGRRGRRRTDHQ